VLNCVFEFGEVSDSMLEFNAANRLLKIGAEIKVAAASGGSYFINPLLRYSVCRNLSLAEWESRARRFK
jgi:hypothetical protein